jgi:hypothetical protein
VSEAVAKADLARWRRFWRDRHREERRASQAAIGMPAEAEMLQLA